VTKESTRAPLVLRAAAAALRTLPHVRGRGRLEVALDRALGGHGWREVIRVRDVEMEVALDDLVGRTLYLNGVFEPMGTAAARALVEPGAVVFDVGAHVGYYSLLFSRLAGPRGLVQAFEPVPETAARLRSNLARNPALEETVRVLEFALSDGDGRMTMHVAGPTNPGASHVVTTVEVDDPHRRAAGVTRTKDVECRAGDSVWAELGRPNVGLVKIDVEGHELHVLRGLHETLRASRCPVLTEVRDRLLRGAGGSREQLFGFMDELGYSSYDLDTRGGFVENGVARDGDTVVFSKEPP
jgi:FkbM family methyltransferase